MELSAIKVKSNMKRVTGSPKKEVAYGKLARSSWRGSRPSATSVGSQGKRGMRSPLYEAVLTGNIQDVKRVLADSVTDFIDNLDDEGLSLLHQATMNGFDDIVSLLIEHGASVGLLSTVGSTPLLIALR